MMKRAFLAVVMLFAAGCVRTTRHDLRLLDQYKVGTSHDELAVQLAAVDAKRIEAARRPAGGWVVDPKKKGHSVVAAAFYFEQRTPGVVVHLSELYSVWRLYNYSSAFSVPGIWYDYLFFDQENKLLGHRRVFVD